MRPTTETAAEIEHAVLTTDAGLALLAEVSAVARPVARGPDAVAEGRARRIASPRPCAWPRAAVAVPPSSRGPIGCGSSRPRWSRPPPSPSPATRPRGSPGPTRVDLCCGIGGDAIALAGAARRVVAVDRDLGMVRRAVWNARAYDVGGPGPGRARPRRDVRDPRRCARPHRPRPPCPGRTARRRRSPATRPAWTCSAGSPSRCRGGAIKLGPASDFADHFADPGLEIELVSLGGECKEATVWFGDLAALPPPRDRSPRGRDLDRSRRAGRRRSRRRLGPWIFDPDPALIRSGLLDGFAVGPRPGAVRRRDRPPDRARPRSPRRSWRRSRSMDVLPLDLKRLRRVVRTAGSGRWRSRREGWISARRACATP